jgi:hypothetical protein
MPRPTREILRVEAAIGLYTTTSLSTGEIANRTGVNRGEWLYVRLRPGAPTGRSSGVGRAVGMEVRPLSPEQPRPGDRRLHREGERAYRRSVTEPIDTTGPQGELVFVLLTGMAGRSRRTSPGAPGKEAARLSNGAAPYGYRREGGRLVIVPEEADVVRRSHRWHRQGLGAKAIPKRLTAEGFPTRSGRSWHFATVAKILDQPLNRGTLDVVVGRSELARHWTPGGQRVLVPADVPRILPVPKPAVPL